MKRRCPVHDMPDCSPLLNGCSRLTADPSASITPVEPLDLLAVIEDIQGRRYFRWSYDAHTFSPWRLLGAVHADTDENFRWVDLTGSRKIVAVVSNGVPIKVRVF